MKSLLLFSLFLVVSCRYYFEISFRDEFEMICANYSPIIAIEKYFPEWVPYVVLRFTCKGEEENDVYGPGEWTPLTTVAHHGDQAVSHNCDLPNQVVSGVHVIPSPYVVFWSFYCSTVTRNWTISSNCTNMTFTSDNNVTTISSSGAIVSVLDVYTQSTYGMNFNNMWILKTCEIGVAATMTCNGNGANCSNVCCKDVRIVNSIEVTCHGNSVTVKCRDGFYWTGGKSMCSTDIDTTYHYCRSCTGSSYIQHCNKVICSTRGYYKCLSCLNHHPNNGLPLVPNRNGRKCRSPGRVAKFEVLVLRDLINFCFGHNLLCEGTGQKPLTIAIYDANNTKDGLEVEDSSLFLPTCLLNNTFACKVSNRHGSEVKYVSINVLIVPIKLDPRDQFLACVGHNVSLPCIEEGRFFFIDWYFRGRQLDNRTSIHYRLLDERGILLLLSVGKENAGHYQCKVMNGMGLYKKMIWLIVGDYESCQ